MANRKYYFSLDHIEYTNPGLDPGESII